MKPFIPYSLLAAVALCGTAFGQTATTTPVGYVTQELEAGKFSFVGLTLHQPVVSSGVIDAESSTSVTDTGVDFSTLLTVGSTYILELGDGTIQEISSWNASGVLTTPEDITGQITPGTTTYKLRKAATVSDVFGATNSAGLASTDDSFLTADLIYLIGAGGSATTIYYYDDGEDAGWTTTGGVEAGNMPIVYADGFYVLRRPGSGPIDLVVSGEVKTNKTSGMISSGWNFLSTVAPVGMTLDNSGLSAFVKSSDDSFLTADNVYIPKADGSFTVAFYYDDGAEAGWSTSGGVEAGDTPIEGAFLVFGRDAGMKPYTLNVPASYDSL